MKLNERCGRLAWINCTTILCRWWRHTNLRVWGDDSIQSSLDGKILQHDEYMFKTSKHNIRVVTVSVGETAQKAITC